MFLVLVGGKAFGIFIETGSVRNVETTINHCSAMETRTSRGPSVYEIKIHQNDPNSQF